MRRFLKYILYLFLGIFLLLILLLGFTQTQWFRDWLRDFVAEESQSFLNGELQIGKIRGNLVTHLEISGILLKDGQDTVLYIPKFRVDLKPMRILQKEIRVDSILIDSLYANLYQLPDSSWNAQHLLKSDTTAVPDTAAPGEPFAYQIILGDFHLKNARLDIASFSSIIPKEIRNFNTRFSANYSNDEQVLNLEEFRFQTKNPDLNLREISFRAARTPKEISLKNFVLQTAANHLDAEAEYYPAEEQTSNASLNSEPIHFKEFRFLLPDMQISAKPELSLVTHFRNDSLNLTVDIKDGAERITLQSELANLNAVLSDSASGQFRYSLNGALQNIHVAHWLGNPEMDYLIQGDFKLQGSGLSAQEAIVAFEGNFPDCVFLKRPVSAIRLSAKYSRGDLESSGFLQGDFGRISLDADITGIGKQQAYSIQANLQDVNAGLLLLDDSLQTDINMNLFARGQGLDPAAMKGEVKLIFTPSTFADISIDTFFTFVYVSGENYDIEDLHIGSNFLSLNLNGNFSLSEESSLNFSGQLRDLMALNHFINADTIHAAGTFSGQVSGKPDSLSASASLNFRDIVFNAFSVDSLGGKVSVFRDSSRMEGGGEVHIREAGNPAFTLKTIDIQTDFSERLVNVVLDAYHSDSLNTHLETQFVADSIPRVIIPEIRFKLRDREWSGGSSEMQLVLDGDNFHLQNIKITSPIAGTGDERSIKANGTFSLSGEEDLQVHIAGLDIAALSKLGGAPLKMGGLFFTDLDIRGTAEKPVIKGTTAIQNGSVEEFSYKVNGQFDYDAEELSWDFALIPNGKDSLVINGYLPINLSLTNQGEVLYENRPLEVNVLSSGIPLTAIQVGIDQLDEVQGAIVCDLKLSNTLKKPRAKGFFNIVDGAFKVSQYGIDYNDFQLRVSVDSNRISIDNMQAKREDGFVKATGNLVFDSTLVSGVIKSTQFNLLADKFFLARQKDYEIQISADMNLSGNTQSPEFGGKLTVLRSSFYLPAFMQSEETPTVPEEDLSVPMLVEALENSQAQADSVGLASGKNKKEKDPAPEIYQNLRGSLKVSIPRNTWIKSPQMRLEIDGDLDLVKSGPNAEIFGTITIVRGHYDLFGRRFNIVEGKLTFQGGEEINPLVLLKAEYEFRDAARQKKTLELQITDKALTPKLQFTLDGEEITEGDAISYVMFGRSLDELTYGQQSAIAGETSGGSGAGSLAMGYAASYLSSEITKSIGDDLNLDYIEIKGQENWSSATFVVGKYLTNDLFVSYERGFGESDDEEVTKETITLEYQLTRYIFVQLFQGSSNTSGFDVFFKVQQ